MSSEVRMRDVVKPFRVGRVLWYCSDFSARSVSCVFASKCRTEYRWLCIFRKWLVSSIKWKPSLNNICTLNDWLACIARNNALQCCTFVACLCSHRSAHMPQSKWPTTEVSTVKQHNSRHRPLGANYIATFMYS